MSLREHISELRSRVLKSVAAIVVGTIIAFLFRHRTLDFLTHPYCGLKQARELGHGSCTLLVTGVLEAFALTLKISFYFGLFLSSPVWLWQLWRFVTPGLYQKERRYALSFVFSSVVLFAAGASLAYLTLSKGLAFLLSFTGGDLLTALQVSRYLSFVIAMVLIFGASFEFPLLIIMLNLVGVLTYQRLRQWTRMTVFMVFVFAAVVTPSQDPFTMTAMAVPMCLLYVLALLFARTHDRRKAARETESMYAGLADDQTSDLTFERNPDDDVTSEVDPRAEL